MKPMENLAFNISHVSDLISMKHFNGVNDLKLFFVNALFIYI